MARPPKPELSEQQRRVLELMARGQTNAQIAEALDITLDGAKYHVREVFDKLGVSSREEAVASWRAGMPSLWERLRGWLWPAGAVVAGIGVAVVVVIAVVSRQSNHGDAAATSAIAAGPTAAATAPGGGPGLPADWQLWTAIVAPADDSRTESTTLRVVSQSEHSPVTTKFSITGDFGAVAWSPDGRALAVATQGPASAGQIVIYQRANWTSRSFSVHDTPASLRWSPDGRYIAALGRGLAIYRPDGAVVAEYMPSTTTGETSNGLVWSPGSAAVDAIISGELRVITVKGAVSSLKPPLDLDFTSAMAWAWNDDTTPMVVGTVGTPTANPQSSRAYAIHLASAPPEWEQTAIRATGIMRPLSDAVRAATNTAPKGTSNVAAVTADGVFGLMELFLQSGAGTEYHTTLTAYDGQAPFATLDLGTSYGLPPNGNFAAVVTSGSE
jgi:DNA-binding CsgD family transcriptional regulator